MKARGLVVLLVCGAALITPTGAAAKPGHFVIPEFFSLTANLPKSHGYSVSLEAVGHRQIQLVVNRPGETAYYLTKGRANRNGIEADFGRFGRVSARFAGRSLEAEDELPECPGRKPIKARGTLKGTFRFRGEDGFFEIATRRVKATWEHRFREVCENTDRPGSLARRAAAPFDDEELVTDNLEVSGSEEKRKIDLIVIRSDPLDLMLVSATSIERVGRVIALKLASADEDTPDAATFSPPEVRPRTVTVEPSSPFQGSATYLEQPTGPGEWNGDLRVRFPGLGPVALTGPGFRAYSCRRALKPGARGCKPPHSGDAQSPTTRLYGNGSHSQPLALARLSSLR